MAIAATSVLAACTIFSPISSSDDVIGGWAVDPRAGDAGRDSDGGDGGSEASPSPPGGVLCSRCTSHADCASGGACLTKSATGEQFCGQDCTTRACPPAYSCARITVGTTLLRQCVPTDGRCEAPQEAGAGAGDRDT